MRDIDFLPQRFRERNQVRRVMVWRAAGLAGLGLLVVAAQIGQLALRRSATRQLAEVEPQYVEAVSRQARLERSQSDLAAVEQFAELYTYLQHPWPRSQLFGAVAQTLPEGLALTEIDLSQEEIVKPAAPPVATPEATAVPPARKDLETLREENDEAPFTVSISGLTRDATALQRYVASFSQSPLFASAKLESIESLQGAQSSSSSRFEIRLVVRPGYGQPGGPATPNQPSPEQTAAAAGLEQP